MKEISTAYRTTQEIYDTFRGHTDLITPEERMESGVIVQQDAATNIERIIAFGEDDSGRATQTLSLGRQGIFYFTTTQSSPGGGIKHERITPKSDKGFDSVLDSFFIRAFAGVVRNRNK